ncbi:MAG: hypothetical protein AB7G48_11220 [Nitrospiraceae bacterium]
MDTKFLPLYVALIAGVFAIIGAIVGSFTTSHFALRNQVKLAQQQDRQRAYAEIMGKRVLLMQLLVSRFEAYIHSDYHEYLWKIAGRPKESIDFTEATRWMHKSEDLALEVARTRQSLYESIGLARAVFSPSPELDRLTQAIYHFKSPKIASPSRPNDPTAVAAWKEQAVANLQMLVEKEYGAPLEELLNLLEKNLRVDK